MPPRFVSQAIQPVKGSFDTARMAAGEPGLPRRFRWGGRTIEIAEVVRTWRSTGPCRHGSGEKYVRRHWYEAVTVDGARVTVYFDRQPRVRNPRIRWWLFTIEERSDDKTA